MYARTLAKAVKEINNTFRVLLLTGPRQVGKTTLLELCADEGRNYVTLDDFDVRQMAQNDPGLFIQTYKPPLIIDEVQYAPQLLSYIKIMVDRKKQNGMYWLTGSQKFHLMKGITESLAGRVAIIDLLGLSQAELDGRADLVDPFMPTPEWIDRAHANLKRPLSLTDVYDRIWRGAFPHVNEENGADRDRFYRSYVQTYIQRDVLRAVIFSFISRKAFTACGSNKSIVVHDNQTCCAFFKSSCSNADAIRSTSRLLR